MNERYRLRQSLILIVVTLFAPFGRAVLAATIPAGSWAAPIPAAAGAGLSGEYYGRVYQETNDAALAYVASNPAVATFTAAHVDYPAGVTDSTYADSNTLLDFLGGPQGDGATLLPASVGGNALDGQLITFTGYIALQSGTTYFNLGSDDGALLTIGGATIADKWQHPFLLERFWQRDSGAGRSLSDRCDVLREHWLDWRDVALFERRKHHRSGRSDQCALYVRP